MGSPLVLASLGSLGLLGDFGQAPGVQFVGQRLHHQRSISKIFVQDHGVALVARQTSDRGSRDLLLIALQ